jgi:hypothetical protein
MLLPLMTLISANISDIINWPEKNVGVAAKIFKNDFLKIWSLMVVH